MTQNNIIEFNPQERILEKVAKYADFPEQLFEESERAVPLMLKAMKIADPELKHKIILILGGFAKDEFAWPLYRFLTDPEEDDEIRYISAIQLRVVFPTLDNPQPLLDRIIEDLESEDAETRVYAAIALGWENNYQAVIPLIELLYDSDMDVMQAAVNSLTDLGDDRIFKLFADRLRHGPTEQKRCILFNLWHLSSKRKEVVDVYLEFLKHDNADLRYDSLVLLRAVTEAGECLDAYFKCLKDEDPRIRLLALERMAEAGYDAIRGYQKKIRSLFSDPEPEIQAAAKKLIGGL